VNRVLRVDRRIGTIPGAARGRGHTEDDEAPLPPQHDRHLTSDKGEQHPCPQHILGLGTSVNIRGEERRSVVWHRASCAWLKGRNAAQDFETEDRGDPMKKPVQDGLLRKVPA
jgi:hypothetical protein